MRTILVSGANAILGYGILKSLRNSGLDVKLVAIDIYENLVAEGFSDVFIRAIPTKDPDYLAWLKTVLLEQRVDMLIPGVDDDLYLWGENKEEIETTGAIVLMNDMKLVSLCKDKWLFFQALQKDNNPYRIPSTLDRDFDQVEKEFGLPLILKPRRGYGSKGIERVEDRETFEKHEEQIGSELMVQPFIGNEREEFTTSAFCDGKGGYTAFITLRRRLSREGYTSQADVVRIEGMETALTVLCQLFKPIGPTNFQFRTHDGSLKLLEINPRISSATSIRTAFGYNESLMAVEYFLEGKTPMQPEIKNGRAVRYTEELIFYT